MISPVLANVITGVALALLALLIVEGIIKRIITYYFAQRYAHIEQLTNLTKQLMRQSSAVVDQPYDNWYADFLKSSGLDTGKQPEEEEENS